jgi:hypothetical protein
VRRDRRSRRLPIHCAEEWRSGREQDSTGCHGNSRLLAMLWMRGINRSRRAVIRRRLARAAPVDRCEGRLTNSERSSTAPREDHTRHLMFGCISQFVSGDP